jgi:hypothetical protein
VWAPPAEELSMQLSDASFIKCHQMLQVEKSVNSNNSLILYPIHAIKARLLEVISKAKSGYYCECCYKCGCKVQY